MRVCLVTTGQPSSNPRLVKEADALVEAGYDVAVIGAFWAEWAADADRRLLASRRWTCTLIDWRRERRPWLFWKSRLRHRAAIACQAIPGLAPACLPAAVGRVTPELTRAALRGRADLFIAHNLGALPAAAAAARRHGARLGFDAEDFHSGQFARADRSSLRAAVRRAEERFLPQCDYVTASSPGIADAYALLCREGRPTCVLNVFPLASRPVERPAATTDGPVKLYWFSQTVGPERGLEDVVKALGRFADDEVELHVRGAWRPGYEESLRRLAQDSGTRPERIVSHRPGDPDEMVRMASSFDVGLAIEAAASVNNDIALSNKIFTYLLAGNAVLATRTRGQAALVESMGGAARSYEPGHVDALARELNEWVTDRRSLELARAAAWTYGTERYNWEREKPVFLGLVDAVLRHQPVAALSAA